MTIDPNPAFDERYRHYRPQEPHLVEGAAITSGPLTYFEFADSVFKTFSNDRRVELEGFGMAVLARRQIPCRPLVDIIDAEIGNRQIDLMSIDCEGFDLDVLNSMDIFINTPTFIMIEDYEGFPGYRDGSGESELRRFLTANSYRPIAQLAFSALYVATDWRRLMARSDAFDVASIQGGILP